jgi:hypothetical protein
VKTEVVPVVPEVVERREVLKLGSKSREAVRSRQKPRFLPVGDKVMSAEIAWSNFSQID